MKSWINLLNEVYGGFLEDDGWAIASHIALSMLTSMFPFLIFVTSLAGFFGSKELADEAAALLFDSWPQKVAAPIAAEIHNVLTQTRGGLLTIGGFLALYFSSSAIEALRIGLNRAYNTHETRAWWLLRLESVAYVIVGAVTLLLLAFLVVFAPLIWLKILDYAPALAPLWTLLTVSRFLITTLALVATLTIAHKWLPAGHRRFRDILPGIALTLLLSLGFAEGFGQYLAEFARNYVSTYAGLASVMIALVFLYSLAAIFLLGGEVNAALLRRRAGEGAAAANPSENPD